MQRLPKNLVPGTVLGTTASTLYTVPGGTYTTISAMTVTNTSASVVEVTVYLVASGSSAGDSNIVFKRNIAPGESRVIGEAIAQTLHTGGTIQALASAGTSANMVASGYETVA